MTATELRERVCAKARSWLGRAEADGSHMEIINVYNNIRPLPRGYKMTPTDPWCAAFVSAVGAACGLSGAIVPECACGPMIDEYKALGRWVEADDYPARPGDLIFYDWQDSGRGDNQGSADHVGIVVEDNEHYFTVIEGNYSDAVGKRTIAHNSRYIRGFAVPDYESAADAAGEASPSPTVGATIEATPAADGPTQPRETCSVTLPVLRCGDGMNNPYEAVAVAQTLLIRRGFRCGFAGADGEFGDKTESAVKAFQRFRGIAVDGVVGKETWTALLEMRA